MQGSIGEALRGAVGHEWEHPGGAEEGCPAKEATWGWTRGDTDGKWGTF